MKIIHYLCLISTLVFGCNYPPPEEAFWEYLDDLETNYCQYFTSEALQQDFEIAYRQLTLPDSSYWIKKSSFRAQHIKELNQFTYLKPEEKKLQLEWRERIQELDTLSYPSLGAFNLYEDFQYLLNHSSLSELEKLDIFNSKLRAYPVWLDAAKKNIRENDLEDLGTFLDDLSKTYFLLSDTLPDQLRLAKQQTFVQQQLQPKIDQSCLSIKDLLAYCQSYSNNYYSKK